MAPRIKSHSNYRRRRKIIQDSPLLDLPGEIRTQIYRAALLAPTPIDLWPAEIILDPKEHPDLAQTPSIWTTLLKRKEKWNKQSRVQFRHQRHLEYVRKEMATGLLGTCAQVYYEAAHIFWADNVWRFSGDDEWEGILRFLLSIGVGARTRLRCIEVFAPIEWSRLPSFTDPASTPVVEKEYWEALAGTRWKNHPKMRMAKLGGKFQDLDENMQQVIRLLSEEKLLKELRFIIPRGWTLDQSVYTLVDPSTRLRAYSSFQTFVQQQEQIVHFPLFGPLRWLRQVVLIDDGATLKGVRYVDILNKEGLDVVCSKGCRISVQGDVTDSCAELVVDAEYPAYKDDLEALAAIGDMFREEEVICAPANAGKANKRSNPPNHPRVLKAFGGCRFVWREGWYCTNCQEWSKNWTQRECCWRAEEFVHRSHCIWEWREQIELKKPERARRLGFIRPSGYPIES